MRCLAALLLLCLPASAAEFLRLEGHGGPIKGIAVSGEAALTASFDYAVGVWDLATGQETARLTGHRAAVNAVAFLGDGRFASAGDDFDVILWQGASPTPLSGHQGKVFALAVSPDGGTLASAGWDGWIGLWDLSQNRLIRFLKGHSAGVTDIAFAEGGAALYSASSDGTIRLWDSATGRERARIANHGFGVNRLVLDEARGWLAYGALDGGTRVLDLDTGTLRADLTLDRRPILAMAQSPDGASLAVGDGEGWIMVVETTDWRVIRDFHAARRGPVWALAWTADGTGLLAGGIDDAASLFPLDAAETQAMGTSDRPFLADPDALENGARQFYRKCSICHSLTADGKRRAGPTLFGVFGRRAGSLPGYPYSPAMADSTITWNEETIAKLFELGPDHYTPGSKMPMQRITRAEDRADLVRFLRDNTTGETR